MNHHKFEVVKLYYGDIYTGYCTKPDPDVELHNLVDWTEEYAIKVVDGDVVSYFLLGGHSESLSVTDVGVTDVGVTDVGVTDVGVTDVDWTDRASVLNSCIIKLNTMRNYLPTRCAKGLDEESQD